jgi:thiamine pyrophosphokinase
VTPRRHALVLADGSEPHASVLARHWPGWDRAVDLVIAADGGLRLAEALGVRVDLWVGDGDSVDPDQLAAVRTAGVRIRCVSGDKDESDAELAVVEAIDAGALEITILGALGGQRLDHEIANLALLAHPGLEGRPTWLLADDARVSLVRAPDPQGVPVDRSLEGHVGDLVSLLPFGAGVEGVTTRGLRFPLRDEPLPAGPARGLSNIRDSADAGVVVRRGLLLVVEVPATLGR